MTNPYEPPQERSENRLAELLVPGTYVGGFWGVEVPRRLCRTARGARHLFRGIRAIQIPTPFLAPALAWIGAFVVLLWMLRGSEIGASTRIAVPLLLAIPAYLLYVPVCTFMRCSRHPSWDRMVTGPRFPAWFSPRSSRLSSSFYFLPRFCAGDSNNPIPSWHHTCRSTDKLTSPHPSASHLMSKPPASIGQLLKVSSILEFAGIVDWQRSDDVLGSRTAYAVCMLLATVFAATLLRRRQESLGIDKYRRSASPLAD